MPRIYTVGELLIDFTAIDVNVSVEDASAFAKHPGGAPANAAVAVAKLGGQSSFVGCVGNDPFGDYLTGALKGYGVNADFVERTDRAPTTLAFVARREGEPDYFFVRNPGADVFLSDKNVESIPFTSDDMVHFGTNSLAEEPIATSVHKMAKRIREAGGMLSIDVNLRPAFWRNPEMAKERLEAFLPDAQLLKCNESELTWLTGEAEWEKGLAALHQRTDAVVICTLGKGGAVVSVKSGSMPIRVEGFRVEPVDSTGAGDTFIGAILYQLQKEGVKSSDLFGVQPASWSEYVRFASAAAAISVTRTGAMPSMPTMAEVKEFLSVNQ